MRGFLKVAAALSLLASAPVFAQQGTDDGTKLRLAVMGTASMPASRATISTGVTTTAPNSTAATTANGRLMAQILEALRGAGIADSDIITSRLGLRPNYRLTADEARGIQGYTASNQITVTITNLDQVSAAVEAMIGAGATNLDGPNFGISDAERATLLNSARRNASTEAQSRARIYAEGFGLQIDHVTLISENSQQFGYDGGEDIVVAAAALMAPPELSMPVAIGNAASSGVTVTTQLAVEFALARR